VNAVEVAGQILRVLTQGSGPMRLAEIGRATGMPTAKAHRYLVSLIRAGLVEQDAASSRYDLGPLVLRAGVAALSRSDALDRAERFLRMIVDRTGETAAAAVWGTHGPTLVRLVEARHAEAASEPIGHVCPLTYSGSGLVWCAWGDPADTAGLIARELAQSRASARRGVPQDNAALAELLAATRAEGCARITLDGTGGRAALATPVITGGRLRMALTVFGRAARLNIEPGSPVEALMKETARALAAELPGA
jgi:DNA-binding IclR family transcriptional regulator